MTDIPRLGEAHRRWEGFDGAAAPHEGRPETGGSQTQAEVLDVRGSGLLQAQIVRVLAEIQIPATEEVAASVSWVSDRIASEAGAGLAAQANVEAPRALALLSA